jgi:hypothetical protein
MMKACLRARAAGSMVFAACQSKSGLAVLLLFVLQSSAAQVWTGKTGSVRIHSQSAIEDIDAENRNFRPVLNTGDSSLKITVPITGFRFRNALMQEHFNSEYMESDKFPFAAFSGFLSGRVDFSKNGTWPVTATGSLTIHGITRTVAVPGSLEITGRSIRIRAKFTVLMTDYDIRIPALYANTVMDSEDVEIVMDATLEPYRP